MHIIVFTYLQNSGRLHGNTSTRVKRGFSKKKIRRYYIRRMQCLRNLETLVIIGNRQPYASGNNKLDMRTSLMGSNKALAFKILQKWNLAFSTISDIFSRLTPLNKGSPINISYILSIVGIHILLPDFYSPAQFLHYIFTNRFFHQKFIICAFVLTMHLVLFLDIAESNW